MEKITNVTLFYFSGTGNTRYVANALAAALPNAIAHSIEDLDPSTADALIASSDVTGFGYPIYGSGLPQPMKDFLSALSPHPGKPVFVSAPNGCFQATAPAPQRDIFPMPALISAGLSISSCRTMSVSP